MIPLFAHLGGSPFHEVWSEWSWDPWIVIPLVVSGALYGVGLARLWRGRMGRGVRTWEAACFVAGWLTLVLALDSPIHELSESLFFAHMIQHELLMAVAAPLLVLGRPLVPTLWAIPPRLRAKVVSLGRARGWRSVWRALTRPADAWILHAAAIWVWHVPVLFQWALRNEFVHALQHVSFLGSGLLFWWALVHGRGARISRGISVLYVFTTAMHTGLLGAILTISRSPWYPEYAARAAAYGFTGLEDQQLAGLIMWIPASVPYLIAALALFAAWMRESERQVQYAERAAGIALASPGSDR